MKTILISISVAAYFFGPNIYACSCAGFRNAQHAAQNKDALIVKVKTKSIFFGKAKVEIQKVFRGDLTQTELEVQVQNGGNCNGDPVPTNQTGVLLIEKDESGSYKTLNCADTAIPMIAPDQFRISFEDSSYDLTEEVLLKVLNYKLQPPVKSIKCNINVNRFAVNAGEESEKYRFDYRTELLKEDIPKLNEETYADKSQDLSSLAPNVYSLYFHLAVRKTAKTIYEMGMRLTDPFTGVSTGNWEKIDLKHSVAARGPNLDRYTFLDGSFFQFDPADPEKSFLSHLSKASCRLIQGGPLEEVED